MTNESRIISAASAFGALIGVFICAAGVFGDGHIIATLANLAEVGEGPAALDRHGQLLSAIFGGLMAGFCVCGYLLARAGVLDREPAAAAAYGWALIVWFVVDSTGSVVSGGAYNVIGNAGFLALFWPLIGLARAKHVARPTPA